MGTPFVLLDVFFFPAFFFPTSLVQLLSFGLARVAQCGLVCGSASCQAETSTC